MESEQAAGKFHSMSKLQRGHDFGIVERQRQIHPPQQLLRASTGPRFWDRGERPLITRVTALNDASTGPRFWDRGEPSEFVKGNLYTVASTGPRFWDRGEPPAPPHGSAHPRSFNGATILGSWRVTASRVRCMMASRLQRGHDFGIVESICSFSPSFSTGIASTGPRFWDRGESIA